MTTLSPIDEHLFDFFHDINNIIAYSSDSDNLRNLKEKAEQYLENKEYTDINMQDEKGNTLLHLAFKNGHSENMEYVLNLLLHGADPFIKNHKNVNCFQSGKTDFVNRFWKIIDDVSLQDFYVLTNGYNKNFKQSIFEDKHAYFENLEEITTFLEKNDLFSHNNISHLLCKSSNILYTTRIDSFLKLDRIPEDNSFFLSKLVNETYFAALSVTKNSFKLGEKNTLLYFVANNEFAYNKDFISFISNDNLIRHLNNNNELAQEVFYHFISNTHLDNVNLYEPIFIKKPMGEEKTSLFELLQANTHMYNIFMENRLNNIVPNKDTKPHKIKI